LKNQIYFIGFDRKVIKYLGGEIIHYYYF